jgi:ribosomal protein L40E
MEFCSKCGAKLPEDACFCSKCGVRTKKGAEAGVSTPLEELNYAFSKMGDEMEKAFTTAAKEIQKAVRTVRESVRSGSKQSVVCSQCGERNVSGAVFCYNCGKKIE